MPDVGSGRRGSGGGVARARRDAERKRTNGAASPYTLARFPSRLLTFWEGVKGVMPARLSRQTDTRADSHALAIWLTSQTYCFVIMHVCVLFGGLFLASPLPLSPDCAPPRTRPVRARVPGLAPPELLFKRASPLTRCLNTCSSARSPAPPPAPRSISKYSLRPEPRRPASHRSYMKELRPLFACLVSIRFRYGVDVSLPKISSRGTLTVGKDRDSIRHIEILRPMATAEPRRRFSFDSPRAVWEAGNRDENY